MPKNGSEKQAIHTETMQRIWPQRIYLILGALICLCTFGIYAYQRFVHTDFPYQDEWRYVDRLRHLPETGLWGYLFDRDNDYFMPGYLFGWYLFYTLTHLDMMAMRYTGAIASGLTSALLCVMLYRKMMRPTILALLVITCAPFVVCSMNFWNTYSLAIASLVIPIQLGVILACCWAAERSLEPARDYIWILTCLGCAIFAIGVYPSGFALLPAILIARWSVRPHIDRFAVVLGIAAVVLPACYLFIAPAEHPVKQVPFGVGDLLLLIEAWFALVGNALSTPDAQGMRYITLALGAFISLGQLLALLHIYRLPPHRRERFLIPLALMLFNAIVFLEIAVERLYYPDFEFYPRYAYLMITGPISLMFVAVMKYESWLWDKYAKIGAIALLVIGVSSGDMQSLHMAQYRPGTIDGARKILLNLHTDLTPDEQKKLFISDAVAVRVYPGVVFMRKNHLSIFRGTDDAMTDAQSATQSDKSSPH